MKKIRNLLLAGAVLLGGLAAVGCDPEENGAELSEEASRTYSSRPIDVTIGGVMNGDNLPGTRSQVNIDDAAVSKVTVFLFDHATGKILLREGNQPWVTEAFSNSFSFDLPVGTVAVDIYTICNYGNTQLPTGNTNLKTSDLDGLMYTINAISELSSMPMAGIDSRTITPETTSLNLTVDRLFAIYYVNFDLSEVQAAGYTVDALYLTTHSVNRTVHWFRPDGGDAATAVNEMLDYASSQELLLMAGGASCYVYVTENMQGTISGASSWRTVQADLGSRVARCTYIDLGVKVHRSDYSWQNAYFQVYLGNGDMTSQFDIPRNYKKNITIKIPATGIVEAPAYPAFVWDNHSLSLEPGGSSTVTFSCANITAGELSISSGSDQVTISNVTVNNGSGSCVVTASSGISSTMTSHVTGGDNQGKCQDDLVVTVSVTPQTEERLVVLLSPSSSTVAVGGVQTYTAYLRYDTYDGNGTLIETGEPTEAYPSYFIWSSSNTGVATVSDGVATGAGAGTATITAAYRYGQNESATASLTVQGGSVTTYRHEYILTPDSSSILVNETQGYTVTRRTYTIINGEEQPGYESETVSNSLFDWSSSDTGVATVSDGNATGVDNGDVTITATLKSDSSVEIEADLSVSHLFEFTGGPSTIEPGETVTLSSNTTLSPSNIIVSYNISGFITDDIQDNYVTITCPSTATPGTQVTVTGGNQNKGPRAEGPWYLTVASAPVNPTVSSIVIQEVTNHGLIVYEPHQYQFKCVVTMSDGTVYDSNDPQNSGLFAWYSKDEGTYFTNFGGGAYQINGSEPREDTFEVKCEFYDGNERESATVTIVQHELTFEYSHSEGGREYGNDGYDHLYVRIYVNVMHGDEIAETREYVLREANNDTVVLPGLMINVTYDMEEDGTWTGCNGTVPPGVSARYYVNISTNGGAFYIPSTPVGL